MKNFDEIINSGDLNLFEFEAYRQEQLQIEKQKFKKAIIVTLSINVLVVIITLGILQNIGILIFSVFVSFIAFMVWREGVKKQYISKFKEDIIKKLIKSLNPIYEYLPKSFIPKDVFKEANVVSGYNVYKGEDYFYAKVDDITFEFSDLTVQYRSKNSTSTLFNGTFIVTNFKQNFQGRLVVIPDTMEKTFGSFGKMFQKINVFRDKLITIDNPEFEHEFVVYGSDEAETHKILNLNFCNYLMELKQQVPRGVYFAYNNNKFFVGLFNQKDNFKVDIKTEINQNTLRQYYNDIVLNLDIVIKIYSILEENIVTRGYKIY